MPIPQPSRLGYAIALALLPAGATLAQTINETMVVTASGFEQKVTDAPRQHHGHHPRRSGTKTGGQHC
ncbi:hypothetical protein [Aeromonas veronii]|uniref:hypothetical protein n=1 Tax=Aeromonas veronii TaxID=654 RepID=UPI0024442B49|nr:hypothetical protein [Aeromonas veronii]